MVEAHKDLGTHKVTNQVPPLEGVNWFSLDKPLQEAVDREGAGEHVSHIFDFADILGDENIIEAGRLANVYPPELRTHDRYGYRIDEVRFHPAAAGGGGARGFPPWVP